ncbi:hypothetical protein [Methylobacterium nodulans]|uniref:Uncharacterized protein n=1 Tax=Methylobacterium nodulans (strain LMG 21967 / CNCM I-2342 / ORS 2060) TaxID=460265 RepID=B8IA01_METNO|nr:hypothetical protein [Methylobacterium nodulans]ACL57229.1 conserved hypothetical protein [Methylobacterium nodulans ORS 2060]ACL58140.1 conserved hypothetical protein [Methylobacterium nodulans ORS 2060]
MRATIAAILLGTFGAGEVADALAQGSTEVPIQRDLQRERRLERRLGRDRPPAVDPNVTPDNPDGVVGFDGPPGIFGNDVEDSGPLPPGSPADIDED